MLWTGVVMMVIGAGLASASPALGDNTATCTQGSSSCVFESHRSNAALATGLAMAGAGAVLMIRGVKPHADVTIMRHGFALSKAFEIR